MSLLTCILASSAATALVHNARARLQEVPSDATNVAAGGEGRVADGDLVSRRGVPGVETADPRFGRRVERPNILIIVTDDQPAQEATYDVMPDTMRLFRDEGTVFPNAVVTTPLCCPSRASIFSGKYAHNHGVTSNRRTWEFDTDDTIQAVLGRAGYQSALVGKYLNHAGAPPYFDLWARYLRLGYYGASFDLNGRVKETSGYSTTFLRRKSLRFLNLFERRDEKPWFMKIAPWTPHSPATPEAKYAAAPIPPWTLSPAQAEQDPSDKQGIAGSFTMEDLNKASDYRANQLRSLMSVDDLIARVFRNLERTGEADNTLAIFMSDNGQFWFEHGLRPVKRLPYNASVRVPFFVRWPARPDLFRPGSTDDRIVANIDIAPTVFHATGTEPHYTVDGRDLTMSERTHMFIEFLSDPGADLAPWRSIWTPSWSYVHHYDPEHQREFFAENDPWQLENLYGDELVGNELVNQAELDAWIRRFARCSGDTCP